MRVFVTGATGLIGGTVAAKLSAAGHRVSGLVRDGDRAGLLEERGIAPVVATLDEFEVLARAARAADAVVNAANADNPFAADVLVDALRGSGKPLIHTSGSTVVGDHAAGAYGGIAYTEDTPCNVLPEKASRIATDRAVLAAAADGVRAVVLCPGLVYGRGLGLREFGPQIPNFIALARESGVARHIGEGRNIWSHVHAEDCADAYVLALEKALAGSFFFLEGGEATMRDMARAIGRSLGLGEETEEITLVEAVRLWGPHAAHAMGGNSRVSAAKARAVLSWRPHRPAMLDEIEGGAYLAFREEAAGRR